MLGDTFTLFDRRGNAGVAGPSLLEDGWLGCAVPVVKCVEMISNLSLNNTKPLFAPASVVRALSRSHPRILLDMLSAEAASRSML